MARTVRIEYEGAVYHVMCRGDRGESVFPSKGDREMFLDTLAEACERTAFEIHYDERAAERRLGQACEALGVTLPELRAFRQSDARKQAAAWWVKTGSLAGDEWVGRMLEMGSRANISRAVQAYRRPADRARKTFKNKMTKCSD